VAFLEEPGRNEYARQLLGRLWLNPRPGQILDDEFLVIRPLGRGGLSRVFQVRDLQRNLDLAVKLPLAASLDRLPLEFFINEALAWLKPARHPNLIACDQARLYHGQPVIFMEYIQGLDLSRLTADGKGALYQDPPRASCLRLLDIFIQAARGLDYAHSLGLWRLDLKPRNVLVEGGGRALIGDYGPLSGGPPPSPDAETRDVEVEEGQGEEIRLDGTRIPGTPQYFSPEAAAGRTDAGRAADLWALALTALECFLGRRPWEMGSMAGLALEQYLAESRPPTYLPPGLKEYFRQALAPQAGDRFKDAESVAARLAEIYAETAEQPYGRLPAHAAEETPEGLARKEASLRALGRLEAPAG
jgi:serine/threonine protein kinase